MLFLRKSEARDRPEIESAYQRSAELHHPWTSAPTDMEEYIRQNGRFLLCLSDSGVIVGTFNISGIIRGQFHCAYLGYEAFSPYQGKGYMTSGMYLVIREAFFNLNLHRLEANIQPGNSASINLVARAGFVKEGFSRQYLRIGGAWKDHERWALINPAWRDATI